MTRFLKFAALSGAGLLVDIALALFLHRTIGVSLWLSATLSFIIIGALNYVLFEFWLFRSKDSAASLRRLSGVLLGATVAGAARIATIMLVEPLAGAVHIQDWLRDALVILAGAGTSLVVNFLINSRIVFRRNQRIE